MAQKLRLLVAALAMSLLASGCVFIELVSVDGFGNQLTADAVVLDIAGDGRWVLYRTQQGVSPTDLNADWDVYRRDTLNDSSVWVSSTDTGGSGNGAATYARISNDGRYVAFDSTSSNLVAGDTNGVSDVFLRDINTLSTTRVSETPGGVEGNGASLRPDISADGSTVAYETAATNLDGADINAFFDVYVHDVATGANTVVSANNAGVVGNARSDMASINGNGSTVAFRSYATNLVAGDTNGVADIFVKQAILAGFIERASITSGGVQANDQSAWPSIASSGSAVAFQTNATNLFGVDADGSVLNVVVRDYGLGITVLASFDENVNQVVGQLASINAIGTEVAWTGPNNRLYVSDITNGNSQIASLDGQGNGVNGRYGFMDDGGSYVAFDTPAVLAGDTNGTTEDVYVVGFREPEITSISPDVVAPGDVVAVTITGSDFESGLTVSEAAGVLTFSSISVNPDGTQITATMTVDPAAAERLRTVNVSNPDGGPGLFSGSSGQCKQCVSITN